MIAQLLAGWRTTRDPRLANLIDLLAAEGPRPQKLEGRTRGDQLARWVQLAALRAESQLPRLLPIPWPRSQEPVSTILDALGRLPADPRIARELARFVERTPSKGNWTWIDRTAVRLLVELRDVRVIPQLAAVLARESQRADPAGIGRAIEELRAVEIVAFDTLAEPWVPDALALERRFSSELAMPARRAETEAEHLAAIAADPDNLALRSVYGDWLVERGDPRGEFIGLQIARAEGRATPAGLAREAKLVAEYGAAWAGPLGGLFESLYFEGGMFAGGYLKYILAADLARVGALPGWSTITRIETRQHQILAQLATYPFARLRTLHGLNEPNARAVAGGDPRPLARFGFALETITPLADDDPLLAFPGLPALRELAVSFTGDGENWIDRAPVLERISRLVVRVPRHASLDDTFAALARRGGSLREVEVALHREHSLLERSGWWFLAERDAAPGPFTRITCRYDSSRHTKLSAVDELVPPLGAIIEHVTSLRIEAPRKLVVAASVRQHFENLLARGPDDLIVELPWPRDKVSVAATSVPVHTSFVGPGLLDATNLDELWAALASIGQTYDTLRTGYSSTMRALGKDPLAKLQQWAVNKRTTLVTLSHDGAAERISLARPDGRDSNMSITLEARALTADAIAAWFERMLATWPFRDAACGETYPYSGFHRLLDTTRNGWLVAYGEPLVHWVTADDIAALASRPGLAELTAKPLPRHLLVRVTREPAAYTIHAAHAFSAAMRGLVVERMLAGLGFDVAALADEYLAPVAAELGFTVPFSNVDDWFSRCYGTGFASEPRLELVVHTRGRQRHVPELHVRFVDRTHQLHSLMVAAPTADFARAVAAAAARARDVVPALHP